MKRRRIGQPNRKKDNRLETAGWFPLRLIGGQYEITSRWPIIALAGLTYLLSLPMFEPGTVWVVGYLVLVPWMTAVCIARRSGWVYAASFALGMLFSLTHFRWLYSTTPPGYVLGSLYLGAGFPLAAWPVRHLHRKRGLSVAITLPIVWTAVEFIRSRGPLAFPWFLLGHSQIRLLTMIQIADLVGAFGVTFVVAMLNGWLVDLLLRPILIWRGGEATAPRVPPVGTVVMLIVVGTTIIYGRIRLARPPTADGPRIAVLQGDYLLSPNDLYVLPSPQRLRRPFDEIDRHLLVMYQTTYEADKRRTYLQLLADAVQDAPDMIVLPETPWSLNLNRELRESQHDPLLAEVNRLQHKQLVDLVEKHQMHLVLGSLSMEPEPDKRYPQGRRYNSAFVYSPVAQTAGVKEPGRYDKIHLVLFGEYVPFRDSNRLYWLYELLNYGPWNPWGRNGYEYSLTPGTVFKTFPMQTRSPGSDSFNFGITICYEDVIPQVFRKFVAGAEGNKRVDFMLNISNDGWFGHGSQQAQHLVACAFRAVENRVGIARAVNTGVSGFIDSTGRWHDLVAESDFEPRAGGTGYRVARLMIDPRVTFYSVWGDVFALACSALALAGLADAIAAGVRERRRSRAAGKRKAAR